MTTDLAAALLRDAIISGMRIATETPIEQVPAAIADVLAALLRDVERWRPEHPGVMVPDPNGVWVDHRHVLAALLKDVPRYDTDPNDYTALIKTDDGDWLSRDEVLAALSRALDPALAERVGEMLEGGEFDPVSMYEEALGFANGTKVPAKWALWAHSDLVRSRTLITALLAQNAALRAERDELSSKLEVERALTDAVHRLAKSAKAQIAFTATDGQRLLRKIDVIGVCDDPDFCFDSEGSVARCGPCAVKIAARDGVVLNEYTRSNPQAMRLRRELTAAEGQIATLTARVEGLTGALRDIEADCDADYPPSHGAIKQAARAALSATTEEGK